MRVASLRCRFTVERVREIPDIQGVFTLWDGKECVYVAHTPWNRSLQQCLREHLALNDGRDPRLALRLGNEPDAEEPQNEVLDRKLKGAGAALQPSGSPFCRPAARSPTCARPASTRGADTAAAAAPGVRSSTFQSDHSRSTCRAFWPVLAHPEAPSPRCGRCARSCGTRSSSATAGPRGLRRGSRLQLPADERSVVLLRRPRAKVRTRLS
jgi:hypothetical protein